MTTDPGTREDRACRDADRETFFPGGRDISGARRVVATYCARCVVMDLCLDWALEREHGIGHSGRSGIYGGLTPRARETEHYARIKAAAA